MSSSIEASAFATSAPSLAPLRYCGDSPTGAHGTGSHPPIPTISRAALPCPQSEDLAICPFKDLFTRPIGACHGFGSSHTTSSLGTSPDWVAEDQQITDTAKPQFEVSRAPLALPWATKSTATTPLQDQRSLKLQGFLLWALRDSNPRPPPCKGGALAN